MKTQLWVLPFAFLAVCVSDVMNKASTCGKSINHVQLSSWHNKNWQTVTHLQKGLPSDSSHTSVARSHVPSAISTSHGLLLPVTGENKSCHAMQYYTWPYCHQNITWPAVTRHWENKPCHVMPYYTCSYCHQNITWSAVACHWGKQVMPCHTIHVLIATRTSLGLLSPVTGENKSCHVISCHATLYMSLLPSERHMVCCRLSLWEASHAITDCTVPYHTCHCHQHATRSAVASHWGKQVMPCQSLQYHTTLQSARHTVCCRFSLGQQSHTTHIPHQLSQHTILQHTAPYTPFYIIPHHTTSCHTI